jgi:hypothetical protein
LTSEAGVCVPGLTSSAVRVAVLRLVQRQPCAPEQRVRRTLQGYGSRDRSSDPPSASDGCQTPRRHPHVAGCGRSLAGSGPPPSVRTRRTRPGRCERAGEGASARLILAAGVEPGQSSGRYPILRWDTRFDRRAGKKEPRQIPGLSLREERAPGAESKKASNCRPLRFMLWWRQLLPPPAWLGGKSQMPWLCE